MTHTILRVFNEIEQPILLLDADNRFLTANVAFAAYIGDPKVALGGIPSFWPSFSASLLKTSPFTARFETTRGEERVPVECLEFEDGVKCLRLKEEIQPDDDEVLLRLHSQRIETLGRLAGGVAHDFNNILTGILGHVSFLKATSKLEGTQVDSLSAIEDGARRASLITQQILNYSRADADDRPERVDVGRLVTSTFLLLRGAISPRYELSCDVPSDKIFILADESKLAQVVINLVMNARDAISTDGFIKVTVSLVSEAPPQARAREATVTQFARISVEDNGDGMSSEVIERIFEPYFSTKREKGTGLGLATVDAIVKLYGGEISVKSVLNKGTTIDVFFPMVESPRIEESSGRASRIQGGEERILIIDDEAPVRNVLAISLEHLGYTVDAAPSGVEGVKKYREQGYDLVLLDMIMPQLSGAETFVELTNIDPEVRVLIISGYAAPEAIDFILKRGGKGFVPKPFTIEELAKRVRDALDEGYSPD